MDFLTTKFCIRFENDELELVEHRETTNKGYIIYWCEIDKIYYGIYGAIHTNYKEYCYLTTSTNKAKLKKRLKEYLKD